MSATMEQVNLDGTIGDAVTVAARAWAAERGLLTWHAGADECKSCGDERGGAMYEIATVPGKDSPICWECLPVPGSPLANWEHWSHSSLTEFPSRCVRCNLKIEGGSFIRGGPVCWSCGSPDKATEASWLLALRDNPDAPVPWACDRVDGGQVKLITNAADALRTLEEFLTVSADPAFAPNVVTTLRGQVEGLLSGARQYAKRSR